MLTIYTRLINRLLVLLAVCCAGTLAAAPSRAIVNGEAPAEDERRFDAVGAFSKTTWLQANPGGAPGDPKDAQHNWFGGATLVAPDLVIFAAHLLPRQGEPKPGAFSVRFRRHKDGSLGSRKAGPESYHLAQIEKIVRAPGADMAIGILKRPVEHIQPIPLRLIDEPLDQAPVVIAGWGSENKFLGAGGPRRELRIGRTAAHRPPTRSGISLARPQTEMREWRKNPKTQQMQKARFVADDTPYPNMHDSGGAMLHEDEDGNLSYLGVITTYSGGGWVGVFDGDDRFPLHRLADEGSQAFAGLPYRHEAKKPNTANERAKPEQDKPAQKHPLPDL